MMAYLEVTLPDGRVERFELAGNFMTIGRSSQADIQINETAISRLHARIERTDEGDWRITDLGSTNRIRIDDQPIRSHVLRNEDRVSLGTVEMVFRDPTASSGDPSGQTAYASESDETAVGDAVEVGCSGLAEAGVSSGSPASRRGGMVVPRGSSSNTYQAGRIASDRDTWAWPVEGGDSFDDPPDLNGRPDPTGPTGPFQLTALLRFKWTILVTFLLLAGAAIPAIWLGTVPMYRAVGEVRVRPIRPLVFPEESSGSIRQYKRHLNTQVSIIKSPTVLQRVLDHPQVQQTEVFKQWAAGSGGAPDAGLGALGGMLEVSPRRDTELIEVAVALPNPQDAAAIVNAVIDQYAAYVQDSVEEMGDLVQRKLKGREKVLDTEIRGLEGQADRLRKRLGTNIPDDLISQKRMRLDEKDARLNELQNELWLAEWRRNRLEPLIKRDPNTAATQHSTQVAYQDDAEWRQLRAGVMDREHRIAVEKIRYGDDHPTIIQLREGLKIAERSLRDREEQLKQEPGQVAVGQDSAGGGSNLTAELYLRRSIVEELKCREERYRKELLEEHKAFDQVFEDAKTLGGENENIARLRGLLRSVQTRLDHKLVERDRLASIEVLSRAAVGPYSDRRRRLTVVAFVGAFGAGLCLALLRSRMSRAFHEAGDLPRVCRTPFLGQLPFVRDLERIRSEDCPALVESVRQLRTVLLQRLAHQDGGVLLVTGASQGCGKTTVSLLLAKSFARSGKKTLLIETDLRKASLSEHFGADQEAGLIASLTADLPDAQAIIATDTPGFSVLPVGAPAEGVEPELLANGVFEASLNRWRDTYDIILLDTPPVLPVADASILSRHADGTIMVVREGHCRRADVAEAFRDLLSSGANLLGTIFIGSDRRGRYASGYLEHYYAAASARSGKKP